MVNGYFIKIKEENVHMETLVIVLFLIFLIIFPIMAFVVIRRVFSIFRLIPYVTREIFIPYLKMQSTTTTYNEPNNHNYQLSPQQIRILEESIMTSSIEINPRKFSQKTKRRLAITGVIISVSMLGLFIYRVFWWIYDLLKLYYF